jgi:hypothetical protein
MKNLEIIQRVSAGIRRIGKVPSAFLFIDGEYEWTWDRDMILRVPVFHGVSLTCHRWGTDPKNCPFIPLGKTDGEITNNDRALFAEAWSDETITE